MRNVSRRTVSLPYSPTGRLSDVAAAAGRSRDRRSLMATDEARKGDLDGRGALSQSALIDFCTFFLECCLDQVRYMRELLEPSELQRRIELYVREEEEAERLPKRSFVVLRETLLSGEVDKGRVPRLIDMSERTARCVISALLEKRLLLTESHKAPRRFGFPIDVVDRRFPTSIPFNVTILARRKVV